MSRTKKLPDSAWYPFMLSALEWTVIWYAVNGVSGAGNIVKLLAALNALFAPVVICAANKSKEKNKRPLWERRMLIVSDTAQALILCWFGWWWCAIGYFMGLLASTYARFETEQTNPE